MTRSELVAKLNEMPADSIVVVAWEVPGLALEHDYVRSPNITVLFDHDSNRIVIMGEPK